MNKAPALVTNAFLIGLRKYGVDYMVDLFVKYSEQHGEPVTAEQRESLTEEVKRVYNQYAKVK
jgi:hypothetical protein